MFCSYYINHYTKTTTWEDPRDRYQQIGKAGQKTEKENVRPDKDQEPSVHQSVSMVPLANQQVASMRRELEAEQALVYLNIERIVFKILLDLRMVSPRELTAQVLAEQTLR